MHPGSSEPGYKTFSALSFPLLPLLDARPLSLVNGLILLYALPTGKEAD
jgi:hypothetical protein